MHQAQFDKMPSITGHQKPSNAEPVLISGKQGSTAGPVQITGKICKSSVAVKKDRVPSISLGLHPVLKKVVPGRFSDDDGNEEENREDDVQNLYVFAWMLLRKQRGKGNKQRSLRTVNPFAGKWVPTKSRSAPQTRHPSLTKCIFHGHEDFPRLRGITAGTTRARTSTLMAQTASSLTKTNRLPVPSDFPFQVKDIEFSDGPPKSVQNLQPTLVEAFGVTNVPGSRSCHRVRHCEASNPAEAEGNSRTAAANIKGGDREAGFAT
ncbi:hypothetical protein F4604DRAFT_1673640 [Suillus subluteus]|nr:hypothetical protein F4604DRAFT_1673640 [Suillus subluteus]